MKGFIKKFDGHLQPTQIALGATNGATNLLKLDYSYGEWDGATLDATKNNGNVAGQMITVKRPGLDDLVFNQKYLYDSLNRITSAEEKTDLTTNWNQTYTFDRYGNRNFDENLTTTLTKACMDGGDPVLCELDKKIFNPDLNPANNRMATGQGYTYDAAGNVTVDAEGRQFTYDAENKQIEVENSMSQTVGHYFFDGDGKRVKKIVQTTGEVTVFVYDASGKLIGEYSTVIEMADPKVQYLTNDHLGSPRINTDQDGQVTSRTDYMPYGEEIIGLGNRTSNENYTSDDVRQGFTGYENDEESGLSYAQARMYLNGLGRFTSPDPLMASGRVLLSQSWNRYVYSLNNPINLIDPSGLYECRGTQTQCDKFRDVLAEANAELEKIKEFYGEDSDEYTKTAAALGSYGCEVSETCKGNGVIVTFGEANGDNNVVLGDDKTVTVTFDAKYIGAGIVGHEGVHVSNAIAATKGRRTSKFADEFDGSFVNAVLSESSMPRNSDRSGVVWLQGIDGPRYNSNHITWDSTWDQNVENIRTKRREAIETYLRDEPAYGLTPTNDAGKKPAYVYTPPPPKKTKRPARRGRRN